MIVLVCGGRTFATGGWREEERIKSDRRKIWLSLDQLKLQPLFDLLIEGGAEGADFWCGKWADEKYIPHLRVPAPWPQKGKSAGIIRNLRMRDFQGLKPDILVAFPGGNGTAHMIKVAADAGIPLWQPQQHAELPSQLSDLLRIPRRKS